MHHVHDAQRLHDVRWHDYPVRYSPRRDRRKPNLGGNEDFLRERGGDVTVMNVAEMMDCFAGWMDANPDIWNEDIGR